MIQHSCRSAVGLALVTFFLPILIHLQASLLFASSDPVDEMEGGEIFIDTLDVHLVNVDVYVTDKKGRRVHDLKAEDFEIFEDGRPMNVSHFFAMKDGRPASETVETLERTEVSQPAAEAPQVDLPADQRLHLIVYIDNLHIRPFNRNKVLARVRNFLRTKMQESGQAMLVTFERTLKIRHGFTDDVDRIAESTYELEDLSAFTVQRETDRDNVIKRILRSDDPQEAESHADFYAKSVHADLEMTIRGMRELIGLLAGLPGRKALLYVSDGLEMRAGQDLFELAVKEHPRLRTHGGISTQSARYDVRRRFQEVIAQANANRVTFYTMEAAGLRSHSSLSAERAGGTSTFDIDVTYQMNRQESLLMLADDTGGLATISTNNFDGALGKMAEDFGSYYSLGYSPAHAGDGRFHRIKVKVKRPGLKVRHRDGYRDKSTSTRIREGTLASLIHQAGTNPLRAEVKVLEPVSSAGELLLPIEVHIPIGEMALLPAEGVHRGKLLVSLAVMDDDGETSPVQMVPVPVEIPAADLEIARTKNYVYSAALQVRPGRHKIAIGVRDEVAGSQTYLSVSKTIGPRR